MAGADLVPGVTRLRPDDHFMILSETDASPMHVGALILLEVPAAEQDGLAARLRDQLAQRLPATPLLARLVQAPDGYDSDVWADVATADLDRHVVTSAAPTPDVAALRAEVARLNLVRLDLSQPPFMAYVFPHLPGGTAAVYFKLHHAVADGIGFQEVLRLLSDEAPPPPPRTAAAVLPAPDAWRALSQARFTAEEATRNAQSAARKAALAALEAYAGERAETPVLKLSGPTSAQRSYTTLSVPLAGFKAAAKALGATINDLFLACAGTALRDYLIEIDDLPAAPPVINSARSYRRAEHGSFGNRIVAQHPHLATHLADPLERLRAVQASMAAEMRRTGHDEALLDALEKPFGARDRRVMFAERMASGRRVLPGNISLSNVPGPAGGRSYAGYRQRHNFPVPIIGSGRFLNITSRRSGDNLDMGVIADPEKIADVGRVADLFGDAVKAYTALADASNSRQSAR
ncbi:wax ester/triacylglycerol synthase domain-containing protein [Novosphingobium sp.]|uniref:wax ester/triacylglycerol synthase domain-containing protein n=1 Tax=Novosphingobium sp. TaxID=1874826 RepID=UPI002736FC54|nr:wax ester/triacylglycerol synthase domain-containing protein [Novosphingobium sp.]MDP3906006.1 wax ester/triacylglycerol synthase family O-acyltransferase [Novosphingobium sp.]